MVSIGNLVGGGGGILHGPLGREKRSGRTVSHGGPVCMEHLYPNRLYIIASTLIYFLGFLRPFHLKNDTRRQNLRTF